MEKTAGSRRKICLRIVYALSACLIAGAFFLAGFAIRGATDGRELGTVRWVLSQIEKYYYEDFTQDELIGAMTDGIDQLLLDRYSGYYSAEEYALIRAQAQGNKSGTGLTFASRDTLTVYKVAGNSPAERAGIQAGDAVVALDLGAGYVPVTDYEDFSAKLSAYPAETELGIRVSRAGENKDFRLSKEQYVENCVYYADRERSARFLSEDGADPELTVTVGENAVFDADTAYLKLTSFTGQAKSQFAAAMNLFRESGKRALVLDLRSNGGGNMAILEEIAGYLAAGTEKNFPVAIARYKTGKEEIFRAPAARYASCGFREKGIAVIADSGSASASEALIGAMLDYGSIDRSRLIVTANADGRALTYGKGIMQTTFERGTGEAIKLTTAHIYWPKSDTCIHGTGIGTAEENRIAANAANVPYSYAGDAELLRALSVLKA